MITVGSADMQEHAVRWFFTERQDLPYYERFELFFNNFGDRFRDREHYRQCLESYRKRVVR